MPLEAALPVIMQALSTAQGVFNANSTKQTNKQAQEFALKMYEMQKQDNYNQWQMQNQYNDPRAQMQRLQQAGLNPNLIYDKGATSMAQPIPTASPQSLSPNAPQFQGDGLMSYFNAQQAQVSIDNLRKQGDLLVQQAANAAANTAETTRGTKQATELAKVSADTAWANLRNIETQTQSVIASNERADKTTKAQLEEVQERITSMRLQQANTKAQKDQILAQTKHMQQSNAMQKIDLELKKIGINPTDPQWQRVAGIALDNLMNGKTMEAAINIAKNWYNSFKK